VSYGWQTLAVDGAALATGLALASSPLRTRSADHRPSYFGVVAATLYLGTAVAAPPVHFAHRQVSIGMGDLGARLTLPPLGALAGMLVSCLATYDSKRDRSDSECASNGAIGGSLVGSVAAAGLDAFSLARDRPDLSSVRRETWFGWQILLADAAGLGLGVAFANGEVRSGKSNAGPMLRTAVGMYTVGFFVPPLIHFFHGQFARGLGDWAARALLTPLGMVVGLVGYCAATGGADGCTDVGVESGFLAATTGMALFDATALAWAPVTDPSPPTGAPVPTVMPVRSGAIFGLAAAF
jgi:hypothetical protein